ncbi:ribbon-helix-helix domain-containing protein [Niveispirillum fermenti]|uniref:ribbon-helix-helix domain-containing protein n=1 Tax=Niveispirillum fermenti TaxID=1233113 RepID=UPI003A8377BF
MPPLRKPALSSSPPPAHPLFQGTDLTQKTAIRNVQIHGRRTSLRLVPDFWNAIELIAETEKRPLSEILGLLDVKRGNASLTAAVRIFALNYFRLQAPPLPASGDGQHQATSG